MKKLPLLCLTALLPALVLLSACQTQHRVVVEHKVEPININIAVTVKDELDSFYDFRDAPSEEESPAAASPAEPGGTDEQAEGADS